MSSARSRSDHRAFDDAVDAVAAEILQRVEGLRAPVVLVDGRSGSGKTTLVGRLAARWPGPVQVVALDDLYPGWDGLDAGAEAVVSGVLAPRAAGEPGVWRRWDWSADDFAEEHVVPPEGALVVEGSGALTPRAAEFVDVSVWLESPETSRRRRALERDGDLYRPHWDRWASQEEAHLQRDRPAGLALIRAEIP